MEFEDFQKSIKSTEDIKKRIYFLHYRPNDLFDGCISFESMIGACKSLILKFQKWERLDVRVNNVAGAVWIRFEVCLDPVYEANSIKQKEQHLLRYGFQRDHKLEEEVRSMEKTKQKYYGWGQNEKRL